MRLKIGTRKSQLAMHQAQLVESLLEKQGVDCKIVPIDSKGDLNTTQPLYDFGITGIFTKSLDLALINKEIDIAVHSLKDVPTIMPKNIEISAYLKRGNPLDAVIYKNQNSLDAEHAIVASGSLRRRAFWLNQNPKHQMVDLRGNIQTRFNKLLQNNWHAAIFAQAGINRSNLPKLITDNQFKTKELNWMLPAPSQGIIAIANLKNNRKIHTMVQIANHEHTKICAVFERSFLRSLEGGCSMPIGILTKINEKEKIEASAAVISLNGLNKLALSKEFDLNSPAENAATFAQDFLNDSLGKKIIANIKQNAAGA